MDTNIKRFILTYGTPLMHGGTLQKEFGTLTDTTSGEKLLLGEYSLTVDSGDHVEITLNII